MELLIVLAVLAVPVSAIAALVLVLRLRTRVERLEWRLARAEAGIPTAQARPLRREPSSDAPPEAAAPPSAEPARVHESPEAEPPIAAREAAADPAPAAPARGTTGPGLEEQLGTRWAVWVGGLALALGGIFLVRYSIEQGLLGPGARVAAGALFALVLAGAGEWLRRRETALSLGGIPSAHIPSILTGAGVLTAFATAYAAYALYGLIGPAATFVLLGLTSLLGLVASALHGPALAGLGLLASLASPLLVSSDTPKLWPVVLYLTFAIATAYGLARLRLWRWLAVSAAVGGALWTLLMAFATGTDILPVAVHLLLQMALACFFLGLDPHRGTPDAEARPDLPAAAVLFLMAVLAILIGTSPDLTAMRPVFATASVALLLFTGIRAAPIAAASAWAGVVTVGTLIVWPVAHEIAGEMPTVLPGSGQEPQPASLVTFLAFAAAMPLGIAALSLRRAVQGRELTRATLAFYLGAAILTPLAALVATYWRVTALDRSLPFALLAGAVAAAFIGVVRWLQRQDGTDAARFALGAAASGALAALALGLTFALEKGMLTVAFALMALGTAWVADRAALPALRYAVGAVGLLVLGRLVWSPTLFGGDPGAWPILNWLLWGYGVPAVAFFLASRLMERHGRDWITRLVESLALVFATFLVVFEIRHAIHGYIDAGESNHLEAGLLATSALAFATLLVRVDIRRPDPVYRVGSQIFSAISVAIAGLGLLVLPNPLFSHEEILGGAIFNSLIPAYLLPAVLAGGLAYAARSTRPSWYVLGMGGLALLLHLAYMLLAIRRFFHGPEIGLHLGVLEAEQWTYSLALIACGLAVLAVGLARPSRFLRLASVVYLMLAVAKVFLVDLSNLEGIMRALSFIGLGGTLIGIGLVYQRLLMRRPQATGT